jgi:hypothetical protein
VTHPFGGQAGKLPVRGQIRVMQVVIYSALMVNLRRIWHHEQELAAKEGQRAISLLSSRWLALRFWLHPWHARRFPGFAPTSAQI